LKAKKANWSSIKSEPIDKRRLIKKLGKMDQPTSEETFTPVDMPGPP